MKSIILILSIISLLMPACTVLESKKPLSSPDQAVSDRQLEGLWRTSGNQDRTYVYIAYGSKGIGSMMIFGKIKDKDNPGLDFHLQDFFVTRTAKHRYLNLTHAIYRNSFGAQLSPSTTYTFMAYQFSRTGRLVVSMSNDNVFTDAIQSGKLRGTIKGDLGSFTNGAVIEDSSDHILSFIESPKPNPIFIKVWTLTKISGP
jgi:hypothetical protein